jgi:hypothetical protein
MNDEVVLRYETDARSGTPTLKVHSGTPPFEGAEMDELEREVRLRYDRLARGAAGQLTWRSHHFEVEVDPTVRQPTLVLRLTRPAVNGQACAVAPDWKAEFFLEARRLLEAEAAPPLPIHEKGALALVLDELRSLTEANGVSLANVLLAGYLATAEQHCHDSDPARAGVYALGLRGLSRFLPVPGAATVPRERLLPNIPAATEEQRSSPWLRRFFGWLSGAAEAACETPR